MIDCKNPMQEMLTLGHVNLWTCIFTCTQEGYRKGDRHPLGDLLTDPLTGPLTDTLTDLLRSGDLRQARRLGPPEGYRKDSRPF